MAGAKEGESMLFTRVAVNVFRCYSSAGWDVNDLLVGGNSSPGLRNVADPWKYPLHMFVAAYDPPWLRSCGMALMGKGGSKRGLAVKQMKISI